MIKDSAPIWHETQFESALLGEHVDKPWLDDISGKNFNDDQFRTANDIITVGSIDLRFETDPETIQNVMDARHKFYGQILGWDDLDHPLHDGYQANKDFAIRTVPLATFIGTQRAVASAGINNAKALKAFHEVAYLAPNAIAEKLENLAQLGLHVAAIVNKYPAVLGRSPESIRQRMTQLKELGVTDNRAIQRAPTLLSSSLQKLQMNFAMLETSGFNTSKILSLAPSLLYADSGTISGKIDLLEEQGLDVARLVNIFPNILVLSKDNISQRLHYLAEQGLNVEKIIAREPTLFGQSEGALNTKLTLLKRNDIDVIKVINNCPSILRTSLETLQTRFDTIEKLGMQASVVVNKQPSTLSLSSETMKRKVRLFNSLFKILGSGHNAGELIEVFPAAMTRSRKKVLATARFVADHGDHQTVPDTVQSAATLLVRPLLHSLIAASGVEEFSVSSVSKIKTLPDDRSEIERSILNDPVAVSHIGTNCIRLYKAAQKLDY